MSRNLPPRRARSARRARQLRGFRPSFQPLEERQLLSLAVDLSAKFNQIGLVPDGSTFSGGLDYSGWAYSTDLVGPTMSVGGTTFQFGAVGSNNSLTASGQTISLPAGQYGTLSFVGTVLGMNLTGEGFTVHYADGSTQSYSLSMSGWWRPQSYAGEEVAAATPYRDLLDGTEQAIPAYLYAYPLHLDPAKVVSAITLPSNANIEVFAVSLDSKAPGPSVRVADGPTAIPAGSGADGFGTTHDYRSVFRSFTVTNAGNSTLHLTDPIALPDGFSLVEDFGSTALAPGASTTFSVRLDASSGGSYAGAVSFGTDDPEAPTFSFAVSGTVLAPRARVSDGGVPIPDGSGEDDFGTTVAGTPAARTFTVTNVGDAQLDLESLDEWVDLPDGFSLVEDFGSTALAPGASTTFSVRLDASSGGSYAGAVSFGTDDPEAPTFSFAVSGTVLAPQARVSDGASVLANVFGSEDFGAVAPGASATRTFTVTNEGDADLHLSGPISLPIGFSLVSGFGATTLAPGASTTFSLRLDGQVIGQTDSGAVTFATDDPESPSFSFVVSGSVTGTRSIDGSESGFSTTGSFDYDPYGDYSYAGYIPGLWEALQTQYYGPSTATWSFSVAAGVYRITVGWYPCNGVSLATNASYSVEDGATSLGTILVDQTRIPNPALETFADIGTFDVTSGSLSVTLSGAFNAGVTADFVRVVRLDAPAPWAHVFSEGNPLASGGGQAAFGSVIAGTMATRTFTVTNEGDADLHLSGPISLPIGFSLVSGFGATTLAPGQSTTFAIGLSSSVTGSYSGTISLATDDPSAPTFGFGVSGIVADIHTIDPSTPGFSSTGSWNRYPEGDGFLFAKNLSQNLANTATWTFAVAPGSYQVLAGLFSLGAPCTVPYTVYDGSTALGTVLVDEAQAGSAETFFNLGTYSIGSGTLIVRLAMGTSGSWQTEAYKIQAHRLDLPSAWPLAKLSDGTKVVTEGDGSDDFGTTASGSPETRTFTITNAGLAALHLSGPISLPGGFSLASDFGAETLAPGQSTTFAVRLDAEFGGSYSGTVSFGSDDPDAPVFSFAVAGTVLAGAASLIGVGGPIEEGVGADDFGTADVGSAPLRTYTITNVGNGVLALSDPIALPAGFSLASDFDVTLLAPGQSSSFEVRLDAAAEGAYSGAVSFGTSDPSAPVFSFAVAGTVLAPKAWVSVGATTIANPSGRDDFGSVVVGVPATRTYTVTNVGDDDLLLSGPISLPAGFSLAGNFSAIRLAPGASTTFAVRLDAVAAGSYGGAVSFGTNDAGAPAFRFDVAGTVAAASGGIAAAPVGFSIAPQTPASEILATFAAASGATVGQYSATILWPDGTTSAGVITNLGGGTFGVSGTFAFQGSGPAPYRVTISGPGGRNATVAGVAIVDAASSRAPSGTCGGTGVEATAARGSDFGGKVGTFLAPGVDEFNDDPSEFTATIDWGDGSVTAGTVDLYAEGGFDVEGDHAYAQAGTYAVLVTVQGPGGYAATASGTMQVSHSDWSAFGDLVSTVKGSALAGPVASIVDLDPESSVAEYKVTIDWGDGTSTAGQVVPHSLPDGTNYSGGDDAEFDIVGGHTYAQAGTFTATVTVTGPDGVVKSTQGIVTVSTPTSPPPPPPPSSPGYYIDLPATLIMNSHGPCLAGDFDPCTLVWGPTPSELSGLGLGANCYLSTATFDDPYTGGRSTITLSSAISAPSSGSIASMSRARTGRRTLIRGFIPGTPPPPATSWGRASST